MSFRNCWTGWLLIGLCAAPLMAVALPEDRQQPIHVTADSAVQQNGTVTYTGDVVITQGSLRITGDQVVVRHANGRVQRVDASGDLATFQQQPERGTELVQGEAATLIYYQTENRVELLNRARVERGGNIVAGNRIEYLVDSETVRAEGTHADQPGRVEMVLQPAEERTPPPEPAPASAPDAADPDATDATPVNGADAGAE